MGKITDVRFTNITAVSEAGIVVAGSPDSTIEGVVFENMNLEITKQTDGVGGFLDYRSGLTQCALLSTKSHSISRAPVLCLLCLNVQVLTGEIFAL